MMNYFTMILIYVSCILIIATIFVVENNFTLGIDAGKYFWFYGNMGLVCITMLIYFITNNNLFRFLLIDGFVFLFIGCVFLSALVFNNASENSTKLIISALLLVLYLCLRCTLNSDRQKQDFLCLAVIITGLVETIWGFRQLYGFTPSQHSLFKLTGSFFNPGPYAGYLAVVFPLSLQYLWRNDSKQFTLVEVTRVGIMNLLKTFTIQKIFDVLLPYIKKWIGGFTCIAIILVLPAAMSRASWLAAIVGSIVVIAGEFSEMKVLKKKIFISGRKGLKIITTCIVLCVMIASFSGMYFLKKDSADGRLLTWKVSLLAIVQHPLGVGLGHFSSAYGDAQAAYFASGNASETEEFVAGNPEYGFNEFLQIAVESGIDSLLLFIGILVCAFRGLIKSKRWGVMGSLVALLVFACFSYPFSVLPFLIIFVFLLAMSLPESTQIRQITADRIFKSALIRSICVICVPICCTIVTTFCLWKQYPVYGAYKQWKRDQVYYQMGMYREVALNYEPLYPYLNDQIQFLFEYGRSLSQSKQPKKSNEVLQHAMQISCDPMLYNIMGKNCQAMQQYAEAEQCFIKSSNIVPNRIYPYYLLAKLYFEMGLFDKACEMAKTVQTKEPKVHSQAVVEMREEMKKICAE